MRAHVRASPTWTRSGGQWGRDCPLCASGRDGHDPGWGLSATRGLPALCVLDRGLRLQGEHLSPQLSKPMLKHGNQADRKAIGRDGLVSVILSASVFLGRLEEAGGLPPVSETCRKRF